MINKYGGSMVADRNSLSRQKFGTLLRSDPAINPNPHDDIYSFMSPPYFYEGRSSNTEASPYVMSPWNQSSPYSKSPWIVPSPINNPFNENFPQNVLIGSMVREEGHIYSLAATRDLLYTGSDSKNIRVWKDLKEFCGFKSNSGFVKAIVINKGKIFTGHHDGKIRIWKSSLRNPDVHKRIGSLPTFRDLIWSSVNPKNYVEVRRGRTVLRIKHYDAVSCLSLDEEHGLLYSGSWDKTFKVWRVSGLKCTESVLAHDDAINSILSFEGLVFTGAADGTVKLWKREMKGDGMSKHSLEQILLKQENAVTALAINRSHAVVYCGASDGLVNFWQREKVFLHGGVLRGHKMAVLCLTAAGCLVFSGSADKSICVWRKGEGGVHTCLSVFTGHTGPVKCLAVEEDKCDGGDEDDEENQQWILYSGSLDKSVKVWRVNSRLRI